MSGGLRFCGLTLLVNLKHKRRNLKDRKRQVAQMASYGKQPRSLKHESLSAGGNLALYAVLWLAMCLSELAVFEVDGIKAEVRYLHYKNRENPAVRDHTTTLCPVLLFIVGPTIPSSTPTHPTRILGR